jgi:competence protein ComEC
LITSNLITGIARRNDVKRNLTSRLVTLGFTQPQMDVIKALFLGDKNQMNSELKEDYINSGVVHILAISGLHIGIFMFFLRFVLQPFERFRYGKTFNTIAIILCLWLVAFFTGFSASVVRAVTMFSFLSVALYSQRKHNMYNALFGSLFVLLVIHPQFLFEVGFQMSYVAVFSILTIQPLFKKVFYSKNRIVQYVFDLITVSLAAQLGLLPLSLYYFHHFSGLFLLGNLLILPALSLLLGVGIPALFVLYFIDFYFLVRSVQLIINWLNGVTMYLSSYSDWVFTEIYFSGELLVISYLALVFGLSYVYQKEFKWLLVTLVAVILCQFTILIEQHKKNTETLVFHQYKNTLLVLNNSGEITSYGEDSISSKTANQFRASVFKKKILKKELSSFMILNTQKVLLLDKDGAYLKDSSPDVLLLTQSSRVNLERLITDVQPKQIIADGSNYPAIIARWQVTCLQKNIPFRTTAEKGYCMIE